MIQAWPWLVDAGGFLLLYVLAVLLTWRLRGARFLLPAAAVPAEPVLKTFLRFIARPAAVVVLSLLADQTAALLPATVQVLAPKPHLLNAWLLFWEILLLLSVGEGLFHLFFRLQKRTFPIPDLLVSIVRMLTVLAVIFIVLRVRLNVNITPLLASTALVTAVIGFALQGVLGNLLSGMSLHLVGSILPGDWVRIGDVEGQVLQTNWRETRLRTVAGHVLILPNGKVADSVLHNMSRPDAIRRHTIAVGASYSDAPGDVIDALVQSALAVPDVLREPPPRAVITAYQDFGIAYALQFWTDHYYNRTQLEGDVCRMIWYQFKRRGIEIPFPMSDQLLNDFMAVVYRQRTLPPGDEETARRADQLARSEFGTRLLRDPDNRSLVSDDDWRRLAGAVKRERYTAGETIFRQGDTGGGCYVVVKGRVQAHLREAASGLTREFEIGPGAVFGEMSLLTGLPRTATITAPVECELLAITPAAFTLLLGLHPDIPGKLADLAARRSAENAKACQDLLAMPAAQVADSLRPQTLLSRFLRLLGRQAEA